MTLQPLPSHPGAHLRPVPSPPRAPVAPRDPRLDLRVGDAERALVLGRIDAAFELGQLTWEERDDRAAAAQSATHARDLVELTFDLPDPAPARGATAVRGTSPWAVFDVLVAMLGVLALLCLCFWQLAVIDLPHGGAFVAMINGIGAAAATGAAVHLLHRAFGRRA